MSVLIKSMEMPKSCCECPLMEYDEETGCYCYLINQYASKTRPDDCPLIELPPHGDLIDRQALLKGEGRYLISLCKEGIDIAEILRAKIVIPAEEEV